MHELTSRQAEILAYIRRHLAEEGRPPTRPELARAFDLHSTNGVHKHLMALAAKGAIEIIPNAARGIRLLQEAGLPLVGRVAAGSPVLAIENVLGRYPVDPSLFTPRADYLLQVVTPARLALRFDGSVALFVPCTDTGVAVRQLLSACQGVRVTSVASGRCCGWGGNLVWRHPDVSRAVAGSVVTDLVMARADLALTTDVGCAVHLAPLLRAAGGPPLLHLAEFLALAGDEVP